MLQTQKLITHETWRGWAGLLLAFTGIPAMPEWMSAGGGLGPLEYCSWPSLSGSPFLHTAPSHSVFDDIWANQSENLWCAQVHRHVCSSCVCIYTYACVHVLGGGRGQPQMLLLRDHPSWFGDLELAGQARAAYQQALGIHLPVPAACCAYKQGPAPTRHPHSHYIYATPPLTAFYERTC